MGRAISRTHRVQVNLYTSLTGAEFITLGGDANKGVTLSFAATARTDGQAIRQISTAIQKSDLPWIDATGRTWVIDLDVLKPLLPELASTSWLRGKAQITPDYEMDGEGGVGFVSCVHGRVLCEISPKHVVLGANQPERTAEQDRNRKVSGGGEMSVSPDSAIEVFFSYSHKDDRYRENIDNHLSLLKREGLISSWTDHKIAPGQELNEEIGQALSRARIILLLISSNFIASDYCYCKELQHAIERHKCGTARVIPIIVKPCDWHSAPFGLLKALPKDGKPITTWSPRDLAYSDITKELRAVVDSLKSAPPATEGRSTSAPDQLDDNSDEPVNLTAELFLIRDVGAIQKIGMPFLELRLVCRSRRPAKIASANLHVRSPNLFTSVQQAFSTDFGFGAGV